MPFRTATPASRCTKIYTTKYRKAYFLPCLFLFWSRRKRKLKSRPANSQSNAKIYNSLRPSLLNFIDLCVEMDANISKSLCRITWNIGNRANREFEWQWKTWVKASTVALNRTLLDCLLWTRRGDTIEYFIFPIMREDSNSAGLMSLFLNIMCNRKANL